MPSSCREDQEVAHSQALIKLQQQHESDLQLCQVLLMLLLDLDQGLLTGQLPDLAAAVHAAPQPHSELTSASPAV